MSIATIVTRGFGSFGSIAEVVTRGYIAVGAAQTVVRGGYPASEEEDKARLKRNKRRLKRLEERRKETEALLKRLLREAIYGPQPTEDAAEQAQDALEAIPAMVVAPHAAMASAAEMQRWETELAAVSEQIAAIERAMDQRFAVSDDDDDDDLEAIIMLLH